MTNGIIDKLLGSEEPSVRYKLLVKVLEIDPASAEVEALRAEIKTSPRVQQLLSEREKSGQIPGHAYNKWSGAHWVLVDLAELGYPAGDESLLPLREQVYEWLFSQSHQKSIRTIQGRVRRCASQEGNALYTFLTLGLADERVERLADCLLQWQWPDGGWRFPGGEEILSGFRSTPEWSFPGRLGRNQQVTNERICHGRCPLCSKASQPSIIPGS